MELLRTDILFPLIIILGVVVILFVAGILYIVSMNRKNKAKRDVVVDDESQPQELAETSEYKEERDMDKLIEVKVLHGDKKPRRRKSHYMPPERESAG